MLGSYFSWASTKHSPDGKKKKSLEKSPGFLFRNRQTIFVLLMHSRSRTLKPKSSFLSRKRRTNKLFVSRFARQSNYNKTKFSPFLLWLCPKILIHLFFFFSEKYSRNSNIFSSNFFFLDVVYIFSLEVFSTHICFFENPDALEDGKLSAVLNNLFYFFRWTKSAVLKRLLPVLIHLNICFELTTQTSQKYIFDFSPFFHQNFLLWIFLVRQDVREKMSRRVEDLKKAHFRPNICLFDFFLSQKNIFFCPPDLVKAFSFKN